LLRFPQKTQNSKLPNFLIETTRLAASLEGLNSSVAQSAGELRWCKVLKKSGVCGSWTDSTNWRCWSLDYNSEYA